MVMFPPIQLIQIHPNIELVRVHSENILEWIVT